MKNRQQAILCCLVLASVLLSSCSPGQLFGPTFTPTPTFTQLPTFTPTFTKTPRPTNTPAPTRTPTPTLPSSGRVIGITGDKQQIVLIDYDYRYMVFLPLERQFDNFTLSFKIQDPKIPIEIEGGFKDADARFIASSESTNSNLLVVCYQSEVNNLRSIMKSQIQEPTDIFEGEILSEIMTTDQGNEVGIKWSTLFRLEPFEPLINTYWVIFLVKKGYCSITSGLQLGEETAFYSDYYSAMQEIAKSIAMLAQ